MKLLLIKRKNPPFEGKWALPGGFVEIDETLEEAAKRELKEETGISNIDLKQLHTFGAIDRDPRGRNISVVYYGLLDGEKISIKADSDACEVKWFPIEKLPELAFDHIDIIDFAAEHIKFKFISAK
jgi:8-oxo-dGTP diphosphatase